MQLKVQGQIYEAKRLASDIVANTDALMGSLDEEEFDEAMEYIEELTTQLASLKSMFEQA